MEIVGDGYHKYSAMEILQWSRLETPMVRVEIAKDALPGGLAMAMAPVMVGWSSSSLGFGRDDYYLVHNVNVSSNPVEGTTMLATVRVPAVGIESVEFVTVMSKIGKVETEAGHALLRFVFREDRRPVILGNNGRPIANNAILQDLLVSWEAWRPPRMGFDPVAGLDPETYALTPRCFNGPVRCLGDAILDRPWICYPLKLPEVPNAGDEMLYVSLLLGDVVARQTIIGLADEWIEKGRNLPGDYPDPEVREWEGVKEALASEKIPENPMKEILDGNIRYHLLLRSCITMALTSIDLANTRISRRGGLPDPPRIRLAPGSLPPFLDDLAHGKRSSALVRLPGILYWLMRHQTVIPGKAHKLLEEAGLLQIENGEMSKKRYGNSPETAYGRIDDNLIY